MHFILVGVVILSGTVSGEGWRDRVGIEAAPETIAPIEAPFDMPQLERPMLPDAAFSITDFGAVPGGETKNTKAINDAIAMCAAAGGGVVQVPAGLWLTGAIHLTSNVNLHLMEGAVLRFSADPG